MSTTTTTTNGATISVDALIAFLQGQAAPVATNVATTVDRNPTASTAQRRGNVNAAGKHEPTDANVRAAIVAGFVPEQTCNGAKLKTGERCGMRTRMSGSDTPLNDAGRCSTHAGPNAHQCADGTYAKSVRRAAAKYLDALNTPAAEPVKSTTPAVGTTNAVPVNPDGITRHATCGDHGGMTAKGTPCKSTVLVGDTGRCKNHPVERDTTPAASTTPAPSADVAALLAAVNTLTSTVASMAREIAELTSDVDALEAMIAAK